MSENFDVSRLGEPHYPSPLYNSHSSEINTPQKRILVDPYVYPRSSKELSQPRLSFEVGHPEPRIFFDPKKAKVAIVTCGGLCPGLNGVIRSLVFQLARRYGVHRILGVRYGYQGFQNICENVVELSPKNVENIHEQGGTILGSSRGTPGVDTIVDELQQLGINILFAIGGDGTMRGAQAIVDKVARRGLKISVIGIPKTIDNDIPYVRRSFGFETAVEVSCQVIAAAHEEARGARNGIGLVKFMGRNSGYIAAQATLSTGDVNFCLIPEVTFELEGRNGLLELIQKRLEVAGHAVIAVAEGAGQDFFAGKPIERDASGNPKLRDIGLYLKQKIKDYLGKQKIDFSLKYIDPSYIIRSAPPNSYDRSFCDRLARNAVHAAMAGRTGLLVGYWHGCVTYVPLSVLGEQRQTINPMGELWFNVLESTGQPAHIGKQKA